MRKAYGSLSLPSHLTVEPRVGWARIRSVRAERSKSSLSTSKSWRSRVLRPWKSTAGCGSNHSKSTFRMLSSWMGRSDSGVLGVHRLTW